MQMPAGEPVLGSSSGNRQLLGDDLKNSDASYGTCPRLSAHPRTGRAPAIAATALALGLAPPRRPPEPQLTPRCDLCPDS